MKETTKARLNKLKLLAKKHGPEVLGAVGTVVATAFAVHFRSELVKLQTIDPDAWPTIEVGPTTMEKVREGAILKYRETRSPNGGFLSQATVKDEFGPNATREFERFRETGEIDVDAFDGPE